MAAQRERHDPEQPRGGAHRQIGQHLVQPHLDVMQRAAIIPFQQRQVFGFKTLVFEALQRAAHQIKLAQHIAEPRRKTLAPLHLAAQRAHHQIGDRGESDRGHVQPAIHMRDMRHLGNAREGAEGEIVQEGADDVRGGAVDMGEQRAVKRRQRLARIG